MGVGDPLEAPYRLSGPIPAGRYSLVGDGIVLADVDMQFDVLWRSATEEHLIARFTHHFVRPPLRFDAVLYDDEVDGVAAPAAPGDLLVLRMTALQSTSAGAAFIPNADGPHTKGRIPSLTLPPP